MTDTNKHLETTDLVLEVGDGVATLTLNRPEKLNSFTKAMVTAFVEYLDEVDRRDDIRVLIITGTGRAFCAGADLKAADSSFSQNKPATHPAVDDNGVVDWQHESIRDAGAFITLRMYDSLKPIIVAFNGTAAGMGVTLSLAADFRLSSDIARFTLPFTRRGIVAESASSWFLARLVGIQQALEWTLTGRTFSAREALEGGLVRSLHSPDELLPAAARLAREIADNTAPVSVALTRQLLWKSLGYDHPMTSHQLESQCIFSRSRSTDIREGVSSFMEKRPPVFNDKVSADLPEFFPWWAEGPRRS
jgi:enoyl-CoA hydratase/carnithine racemase